MTKNDAVERAIKLMSRPIHEACEFIDETEVMPINRIERENLIKTLQAIQTSRPDADRLAALDALESCRVSFNEDMSLEILAGNLRNLIWNHHGTIRAALKSGDKGRKFSLGQRVEKVSGSSWQGKIVGFYSTELTPIGYAVESEWHRGSVQIYPEAALKALPAPPTSEGV